MKSFLLALALVGQIKIDGPATVVSGKMARYEAKGIVKDSEIEWRVTAQPEIVTDASGRPKLHYPWYDVEYPADERLIVSGSPGKFDIELAVKPPKAKRRLFKTLSLVMVAETPPTPVPPVPPGPGPTPPVPPGPTPDAPPFPTPTRGLYVAIVYEKHDLSKYPPAQLDAINGEKLQSWLWENCAVETLPGGSTGKAYRVLDKDLKPTDGIDPWPKALAAVPPGAILPCLVASNGTAGHRGPLPANAEAIIAILERLKVK